MHLQLSWPHSVSCGSCAAVSVACRKTACLWPLFITCANKCHRKTHPGQESQQGFLVVPAVMKPSSPFCQTPKSLYQLGHTHSHKYWNTLDCTLRRNFSLCLLHSTLRDGSFLFIANHLQPAVWWMSCSCLQVQPLLELFDTELPFNRVPMHDKVQELAAGRLPNGMPGTILNSQPLSELHPASWLAVCPKPGA